MYKENVFSGAYDYGPRSSALSSAPCCQHDQTKRECADRYIPSRTSSDLQSGFSLLDKSDLRPSCTSDSVRDENSATYNQLLQSELLGRRSEARIDKSNDDISFMNVTHPDSAHLFKFKSPTQNSYDNAFSLSPVSFRSPDAVSAPKKARKISMAPFKVLDAPQLKDDFYLNLLDWSSANVVAVGLHNVVYLWNACNSRVTKLCDLGRDDTVTSVSWATKGKYLAVGTDKSDVQIWDAVACRKLRTMTGHSSRVGAMDWNGYILSTGSRDHTILHRDVRQRDHFLSRLRGHAQEVCGLKWSCDESKLASGGNDNKLNIFNLRSCSPVASFDDHQAAVKAIAWSPHRHGLLASGGGTADRCIRFWDTVSNSALSCVDTQSQVCNLLWAKHANEIVSTHGYSQNQILLWKYPSMTKVATLTGHTYRVVYLAMSPDGKTAVTGSGDETLRFWNMFPNSKSNSCSASSLKTLFLGQTIR
mmetsp:Transcript_40636/g.65011  ORF Transcript_40636/g.65011 Transcript_40636/m.65011 type:complete len:475 (+) Transcript_40636:57-1481(+)